MIFSGVASTKPKYLMFNDANTDSYAVTGTGVPSQGHYDRYSQAWGGTSVETVFSSSDVVTVKEMRLAISTNTTRNFTVKAYSDGVKIGQMVVSSVTSSDGYLDAVSELLPLDVPIEKLSITMVSSGTGSGNYHVDMVGRID